MPKKQRPVTQSLAAFETLRHFHQFLEKAADFEKHEVCGTLD